ncbi:MAG: Rid family hydrolase [Planctomycetota bacterium]
MTDHLRTALAVTFLAVSLSGCASGPGTTHLAAEGAMGPYSGAVLAGDLCFVSGKIGRRGGAFADEAETAIDAVEGELRRAGLGLGDLVHVTVYLTDMGRYAEFNEIYARRVPAPHPARVCVAVAALPGAARVEVTGIARRR